jgi:alanine racemase
LLSIAAIFVRVMIAKLLGYIKKSLFLQKLNLRRKKIMHSWIELDTSILQKNFSLFGGSDDAAAVMPVLKANAYGHGLKETYDALITKAPQPKWIGVNYISEAALLRSYGYTNKILIMGPIAPQDISLAAHHKSDVSIGQIETLTTWLELEERPNIHLKIDTGLARQGFDLTELPQILDLLQEQQKKVVGLMSHFACVEDVTNQDFAQKQLSSLKEAEQLCKQKSFNLISHIAASAAALILPKSHLDLVRIGISLYGFWPSSLTRISYAAKFGNLPDLSPVLSWKTRISALRTLPEGKTIGYGCTFKAPRKMRIALLPVGYYEGYPRLAGNDSRAYVLCTGKRCKIIARICMNMMMVDVSEISNLKTGEEVVLIGKQEKESITAEQVAEWAQTIQYEITTNIHPQIPRKLI